MYDLTSVMTTIAACSASIVAILGGFIASKLISINADRKEVETRLSEIDEEIEFFSNECNTLKERLYEDDALDFVGENLKELKKGYSIDEVYHEENKPIRSKDVLSPYWNRALIVNKLLIEEGAKLKHGAQIIRNDEGVPVSIAKKVPHHFEYEVCKKIFEYLEDQANPYAFMRRVPTFNTNNMSWYSKTQEQVASLESKIEYLALQKKQQQARLCALEKPKGMKSGLIIFALFSVFNIVIPLVLTPFTTDDYYLALVIKTGTIGLVALGLLAIFLYLAILLRWKKKCGKVATRGGDNNEN